MAEALIKELSHTKRTNPCQTPHQRRSKRASQPQGSRVPEADEEKERSLTKRTNPMPPKETREAAERLRRFRNGDNSAYPDDDGGFFEERGQTMCEADEETLADAYLAEHPADAEEPITEDWLRSVGFEKPDGGRENELSIGENDLYVCFGTEQTMWMARDHYDYTPKCYSPFEEPGKKGDQRLSRIPSGLWPKTRGQLLRLCAALNIPLNPQQVSE